MNISHAFTFLNVSHAARLILVTEQINCMKVYAVVLYLRSRRVVATKLATCSFESVDLYAPQCENMCIDFIIIIVSKKKTNKITFETLNESKIVFQW